MSRQKHEFALYYDAVVLLDRVDQQYLLGDADLVHRLVNVLRVAEDDTLMLFDTACHVRCSVVEITKKRVMVRMIARYNNCVIVPKIIWLLPLLERDVFEEALYAVAAMGATEIRPVATEKSRKSWGEKEQDRARRIMISAAEQSKQFVVPALYAPMQLADALKHEQVVKVFFDVDGEPAYDVVTRIKNSLPASCACLVGPEGDLTDQEKVLVREHGFTFCKLTPTILKASAAVEVGMGIMRSLL